MKKILTLTIISLLIVSTAPIFAPEVKSDTPSNGMILYAGGHNPGVVYRYLGGANWEIISPELGYAVIDLIEYEGHLYAGVTTGFGGYEGVGRVYRYDGGNAWTLVGDGMDHAVISLAVYKGELYAGTGRGVFRLYKYTPGTTNCGIQNWTKVVDYAPWNGVRSLYVSHGYLLMGDSLYDRIGIWDGNSFRVVLDGGGSCIYDFIDYGGYVYAAAYMGRLWRSADATSWTVVLDYYDGNMWELEVFQSKLYMAYNNGELRVYDGTGVLRGTLVHTAQDGIISMATDGNYLYFGTGGDAIGFGAEDSGIASVYRYDGTSVVLISSLDQMGAGVQVLYKSAVKPDLTISHIKPVQAIWDCDINDDGCIDLVQGKATAVAVYIRGFEMMSADEIIEVELNFEGKTYFVRITVGGLKKMGGRIIYNVNPPTYIGNQVISAKVDPRNQIEETNEGNNIKEQAITVKDTRGLHISYFRVSSIWPADYGAPTQSEFTDTAIKSGLFINATYPVAGNEFKNELRSEEYFGDPVPIVGLIDDLISLAFWKWVLGAGDRVVGIVSDNYFPYHHQGDAVGIANPMITREVVLVTNGYWTTTAHEIAHTYGQNLPRWVWWPPPPHWESTEEYDVNPPGNTANGYWVDKGIEISNGICFMGFAPGKHTYDYWDGRSVWICDETYENLFREFRVTQTDPDVLVIGGIVYKNGTMSLTKWYYVKNRTVECPIPGCYSLIAINWAGEVMNEINFAVDFHLIVEPYGLIETNVTGFVFPIPFTRDIAMIKIQYNNTTIAEINPITKLLHDAIDSIPEYGFIDGHRVAGRRKALHNKINEIEEKIKQNLIRDAINKLKFDLRDRLQKWLIDDYIKTDPLQLSKSEVLALVDEIIERLNLYLLKELEAKTKELRLGVFRRATAPNKLEVASFDEIIYTADKLQAQMYTNAMSQSFMDGADLLVIDAREIHLDLIDTLEFARSFDGS